ncbi:hypothetical protein EI94DRAFT_1737575 [Lactarius quietus]|nr:hypothetical protein EI94DRAFT_1737575 [Lactarius quietus]
MNPTTDITSPTAPLATATSSNDSVPLYYIRTCLNRHTPLSDPVDIRGRSVVVFREKCLRHESLLAVAQRTFPSLQDVSTDDIVLPVELSPEIWTALCHVVHKIQSTTTTCDSPISPEMRIPGTLTLPSLSSPLPPRPAPQPPRRVPFSSAPTRPNPPVQAQPEQSSEVLQAINIVYPAYMKPTPASFDVSELGLLGKKVSRLYELMDPQVGYTASNSKLIYENAYMNNERTFADYGIVSGDTILLNPDSRPRKPVIYLYPPSSLPDVSVELALTPSWRFSAVHPRPRSTVPLGVPHTAQSLTWTVAAEPDGTLVDKTSGMEVSYLYWEAIASSHPATPGPSRASTPIANTETFDPARPSMNPGDSVLLPISMVPGYLDVALKALALHTEARTSFITFWLPDMLKHEYVALRFIAQDAYERAAPMRIAPAPDVVTRVFMLFRGVPAGDLGLWEAASSRAEGADGATFWADVVGVNAVRAADRGLFRVLEWGGMEVQ